LRLGQEGEYGTPIEPSVAFNAAKTLLLVAVRM
jgi:hypothetical protein